MSYNFQNVKVLLVEDNQPMANLITTVLRSFGVGEVISCLDGQQGFRKFCHVNPDLVITDWMMEPWDGIKMSKEIRNNPNSPNQFVPIILMTGFSEKRRVIAARDAGITEFLVKPFNTRDLYRRLYQIIERPRQFVKSDDYMGPDRRRMKLGQDEYTGVKKRTSDYPDGKIPISESDQLVVDIDFN